MKKAELSLLSRLRVDPFRELMIGRGLGVISGIDTGASGQPSACSGRSARNSKLNLWTRTPGDRTGRRPDRNVMDRTGLRRACLVSLALTAVVLLSACTVVMAQHKGYTPVADLDAFRESFSKESAKIHTIVSSFAQEKQLIALTETITSTGEFWFKRSNQVRIDYKKPFVYRMIMNGDKILIKDEQKENRINVRSNKLFQQVNRIMLDCIQGSILSSKDFSTRVFENKTHYLLELTPTGKGIRDFFDVILLKVERNDYSVSSIEMIEPGGDKTLMTFTDKTINSPVNDEVFAL